MISLVDKSTEMESNPPKLLNNNSQEAAELLGFSTSDSLDSPSFSHFQAPKQKRKVRFKKPFRSYSRTKAGRNPPPKNCNCRIIEGIKVLSFLSILAIVGALLWYVMCLSQRIQELQTRFTDIEAGNRNTPEALHLTYAKLRLLDANISTLFTEVRKNVANIENITLEVKHLKAITNDLKESIAAAPALQELPKNVQALSESVVSFGSKMVALESNLKELKDQQSNIQTNTQNLSGELDSVKLLIQELSNSTDLQSKTNTSVKENKLQEAILQQTKRDVQDFEKKLLNLAESFEKMNSTLIMLTDFPAKFENVNEAIVLIKNDTGSLHSSVHLLENFIHLNLTLRLDQLESEAVHFISNASRSSAEYINKTITHTVVDLLNQSIFHSNLSQPLEQTHDVLVLLTALLTKFEQIPKSYVLSNANATDHVNVMLQQSFEEMMTSRDQKLQTLDVGLKNLTSCCGKPENQRVTVSTTPLNLVPPLKESTPLPTV